MKLLLLFCLVATVGSNSPVSPAVINTEPGTESRLKSKYPIQNIAYIVGGEPAYQAEFPWLVHLRSGIFCGGAIIDFDLVLTAAHCVVTETGEPLAAKSITLVAGDHSLHTETNHKQRVTALDVKVHESYDSQTFANDIALIRLNRPFVATNAVTTIGLPENGNIFAQKEGTVAGWGSLFSGGSASETLNKVTVPIVSDWTCRVQIGQFCAGSIKKDSCQWDSGSPFLFNTAPSVVGGIVSHGEGCGFRNRPGVYTNVSYYLPWINKHFNFSRRPTSLPNTPRPARMSSKSSFISISYHCTIFMLAYKAIHYSSIL